MSNNPPYKTMDQWLGCVKDHPQSEWGHMTLCVAYWFTTPMSQEGMAAFLNRRAKDVRDWKRDLVDWGFVSIKTTRKGRRTFLVASPDLPGDSVVISGDDFLELHGSGALKNETKEAQKTPVPLPSHCRPIAVPLPSSGTGKAAHIENADARVRYGTISKDIGGEPPPEKTRFELEVNGTAFRGDGFEVSYASIDMAAMIHCVDPEKARLVGQQVCQSWVDKMNAGHAQPLPPNPGATIDRAISNYKLTGAVNDQKMKNQKSYAKAKPRSF